MMSEAFSHPQCAELLNSDFVPVLVDREVRPDIDTIYMNYMQVVNSAGGWPLNLFLTPDLLPVYGDTYLPSPEPGSTPSVGSPGTGANQGLDFLDLLKTLSQVWREQESRCRAEAAVVVGQLREFAAEGIMSRGTPQRSSLFPVPANPTSAAMSRNPINVAPITRNVPTTEADLDQLDEAYEHIQNTFDAVEGGFGLPPKFPTPPKLSFLLKLPHLSKEVKAVVGEVPCATAYEMSFTTLRKISNGGLRDHVGTQGMARYSVTKDWTVPHFEKMVVDNALLVAVYLDAWLHGGASEDGELLDVILELADYLTNPPIRLPSGGLASSEAADSYYTQGDAHLRDGAYQLWTRREFDDVLGGGEQSAMAAAHWTVFEHGNVKPENDPNDVFMNRNVLRLGTDVGDLSRQFKMPVDEVRETLRDARRKLREHRERKRVRPTLDDKAITGWNGLGIVALARASIGLKRIVTVDHRRYLDAAIGIAEFLKRELWDEGEKRLYRFYRGGRGDTKAFAEDYGYVIEGLLELYQATFDEGWLKWADELQGESPPPRVCVCVCRDSLDANGLGAEIQIELFYDAVATPGTATPGGTPPSPSSGGFFSTEATTPQVILRLKDGMDTSVPSTNATSAWNLFRLGAMLNDERYTALAKETVAAFEAEMLQYPWLFPGLLPGVVASRLEGWNVLVPEDDQPKEKVEVDDDKDKPLTRSEFFREMDVISRGELRAVVSVEEDGERKEWIAKRRGSVVDQVVGRGGVFLVKGGVLRRFTREDMVDFLGQEKKKGQEKV